MSSTSNPISPAALDAETLSIELFGSRHQVCNEDGLNQLISSHLDSNHDTQLILAHHNLHSIALVRHNKEMLAYIDEANYVWIDGMPIIWMLQALGYSINAAWRLTFLDWQHSFWTMADKRKCRIFLLGGEDGVLDSVSSTLASKYTNLNIEFHHGYFSHAENDLIDKINVQQPDVLMVGLGMPLQEEWLQRNKSRLNARIIMPLGGYFDYVAGKTYTPPRWSGKVGLEWLFRLGSDPLRLWKRYLLEPVPVLFDFIKEFICRK